MEFVNALGILIIIAAVVYAGGYGLRNRGRIGRWLNNFDNDSNADEKSERLLQYRREIEDAEKEIEKLEKE